MFAAAMLCHLYSGRYYSMKRYASIPKWNMMLIRLQMWVHNITPVVPFTQCSMACRPICLTDVAIYWSHRIGGLSRHGPFWSANCSLVRRLISLLFLGNPSSFRWTCLLSIVIIGRRVNGEQQEESYRVLWRNLNPASCHLIYTVFYDALVFLSCLVYAYNLELFIPRYV